MNPAVDSLDENGRPLLVRLVHTPLPDLLRGRVTGRYDVKDRLMRSGLPEPLLDYAFKVVLRTRLWRSEQVVAAQALADQLMEDLASGRSPEELLDGLEPWKKAARRIRREKRRERRLVWRVCGRSIQVVLCTIALLALVYGFCFARFILGKPTVTRNFVAEMNAEVMAVRESERAWPVYRKAILKLKPIPDGLTIVVERGDTEEVKPLGSYGFLNTYPGDKHWNALLDYTAANEEALSLVCQAANRPRLGIVLGDPADAAEPSVSVFCDLHGLLASPPEDENPVVRHLEAPHMRHLRFLALLLRADAHRAAREGDGEKVATNMWAMTNIVRHYQDAGILGHSMFTAAQLNLLCDTVGAVLAEDAGCLTEENLVDLRACLASLEPSHFWSHVNWERAYIQDTIQRMYTDNGRGNGYFTRHVSPHLVCLCRPLNEPVWEERADTLPVFLLLPVLTADRREMERFCTSILDDVEAQSKLPLWKQDEFVLDQRILELSPLQVVRYAPSFFMLRWFCQGDYLVGQFSLQRYDAARTAIELEQYRRKTGSWPERLEQLVPDFLPVIPPDRFDGEPIKYSLIEGRPVLYSIGVDRVDDGGKGPEVERPCAHFWAPPSEAAERRADNAYRGDWILWPPTRP